MEEKRTICCKCRAHIPAVSGETLMPLCEDCKKDLFAGDRSITEAYLQQEQEMLRSLCRRAPLFAAWLLHDNWLLQQIISSDDERDDELSTLQLEEDLLRCRTGRAFIPALYSQLARYFFQAGYMDEAEILLRNAIGGWNAGVLLYGDSFEDVEHPRAQAIELLQEILKKKASK